MIKPLGEAAGESDKGWNKPQSRSTSLKREGHGVHRKHTTSSRKNPHPKSELESKQVPRTNHQYPGNTEGSTTDEMIP